MKAKQSKAQASHQQWLTVDEVAGILQFSPNAIRSMLKEGRLNGVKFGQPGGKTSWRIHPDALEDFRRSGEKR